MDRLLPELFPLILKQIPLIYRSSTLLSLALTSHVIYNIVVPNLLFKEVQYANEEDAIENLKRLVDNAQQIDQPLAHHIHNLCIITTLRLPLSDPEETSIGCLKKLIDLGGLRNLKALTIKLCAVQASPDGRFLDFPLLPVLWDSADNHCPLLERVDVNGFVQTYSGRKEWIPRENASSMTLRALHLEGSISFKALPPETENLPLFSVDLISLKVNTIGVNSQGRKIDQFPSIIMPKLIFPNSYKSLHTLILNSVNNGDIPMKSFWKAIPKLERLELWESVTGTWFDDFEEGMLPNLKYLTAGFSHQVHLVIPYLRSQLIGLAIPSSYNGQALYLLRGVTEGKIFPQLRYLGIHLVVTTVPHERSDWRESQSDERAPSPDPYRQVRGELTTYFDKGYITSISKAAPYLDTLELLGPSLDSTRALATAFARLPHLRHLILSGAAHFVFEPFFDSSRLWMEYGRYNPSVAHAMMWHGDPNEGFDTLVSFLANQCKSLEVFTMGYKLGDLLIEPGVSAKIIRGSSGVVQSLQRIPPRGNTIGREEDWY